MNLDDTTTPVVVLNCKIGALAIMRSLGSLGVPVYAVDRDANVPGFSSRYCRGKFIQDLDEERPQEYLDYMIAIGKQLGARCTLIPTSDALSVFVAEYADELSERFIFPRSDPRLVKDLMSKEGMYGLATRHGVPTPQTLFPRHLQDLPRICSNDHFPSDAQGHLR